VHELLLLRVPPELADAIVDLAEYWLYIGISHNSFNSAYSALAAPDSNAEWCFLVSPKIPAFQRPNGPPLPTTVKMVKFLVKTYDSAWGGQKEGSKSRPGSFPSNHSRGLRLIAFSQVPAKALKRGSKP
jgi:hypothetical protein